MIFSGKAVGIFLSKQIHRFYFDLARFEDHIVFTADLSAHFLSCSGDILRAEISISAIFFCRQMSGRGARLPSKTVSP
jgi:hypothetical protein